ncbi:MAG: DoxX family protein [Verrucomicrobiota bacterium]|nr:DoxX family protein [Verrucomicrobiota bacterium]
MKNLIKWFLDPPADAPAATILLRLMAGGVFLWEGILKFVYTNQGVGRFTKLGIPAPELTTNFVGMLEIVGGILLIAGFLTRLIAVPFIFEMIVAILSTKPGIYFGTSPLPLPPSPPKTGPWAVLHEIRSDYAQIMIVIFLLVVGPGKWSLDAYLARRRTRERAGTPKENFAPPWRAKPEREPLAGLANTLFKNTAPRRRIREQENDRRC